MDIFWNCKFGQREKCHSDWLSEQSEFNAICIQYRLLRWTAHAGVIEGLSHLMSNLRPILNFLVAFNFIKQHHSRMFSLQTISFSTFFFALLSLTNYFGLVLLKSTCQPKPARKSTQQCSLTKLKTMCTNSDTLEQNQKSS